MLRYQDVQRGHVDYDEVQATIDTYLPAMLRGMEDLVLMKGIDQQDTTEILSDELKPYAPVQGLADLLFHENVHRRVQDNFPDCNVVLKMRGSSTVLMLVWSME